MSSDEPEFLDVEDVIEIHATQLEVYGGSAGLRDRGLLESAVAQQVRRDVFTDLDAQTYPPGSPHLAGEGGEE